jgi:2'-5' RNA ligase
MESPTWGHFALVSYVPPPLGSVLDELRRSLPGNRFPQSHVTILPPRPLQVPMEDASSHARSVLDNFASFDVEFAEVHHFPETQFLYLSLLAGSSIVHDLHQALNSGPLTHEEQFEFRPHLTLGGPIPGAILKATQKQLREVWSSLKIEKRFRLQNVVALFLEPDGVQTEWSRLWTHRFGESAFKGARAGFSGQTS